MNLMGQFEREGAALVWRRGTAGCAVAFGWLTAAFGLLWGLGGLVGVARSGEPLGAVFAFGAASNDMTTASPEAVATGMRITFGVATALLVVALSIVAGAKRRAFRNRAVAP